ncbi:MAG: NAD-dependent epimerase/dehydratase family protein [Candidatus Latescibacterota bacterium]|nr:NAD-dependent epimerase/dehydratase family protein [Candidatus Latescibacterota bacterium]
MTAPLALMTGYPGWLTEHLLRLLQAGSTAGNWSKELSRYRWRALVAPGYSKHSRLPIVDEIVEGDLRDVAVIEKAVSGAQLVLHAGGIIHPRRIRKLYEINGDACRNLSDLAVQAGVQRLVFISSNAAAGFGSATLDMRETDPPKPRSHYGRSKLRGERALWERLEGSSTEGVVLRPTTFYGPFFPRRQLRAYQLAGGGRPPILGDGHNRVSMIYIDDLIDAVGRALVLPVAAGGTYFIADNEIYDWAQVLREMGEAQGAHVRPRYLPGFGAQLCHWLDRGLSAFGLYSMMIHVAGEGTRHMGCRNDRARRELGFDPQTGISAGMRTAVQWARQQGWL